MLCCTVLYFALLYSTLLYCTALHCTALFCTLYTRFHDLHPAQSMGNQLQSIIPDATPMHLLYPASGHLSLFIVYRRKDTRVRPRNEPGWMANTGNTGKWCQDVTRRSRSYHKHPTTPNLASAQLSHPLISDVGVPATVRLRAVAHPVGGHRPN